MKKFCLIIMFLGLFLYVSTPAEAKIKIENDSFDGKTTIESDCTTPDLQSFDFIKLITKDNNIRYAFYLSATGSEWMFFADNLEIKIDGTIYSVKAVSTNSKIYDPGWALHTSGLYQIPDDAISALQKGKEVIFRVNFNNHISYIYTIKPTIVEEWKQVIATKRDGSLEEQAAQ